MDFSGFQAYIIEFKDIFSMARIKNIFKDNINRRQAYITWYKSSYSGIYEWAGGSCHS